jgi:hypothetical protein
VRFEGINRALKAAFRTQSEHKLISKTKTTEMWPQINSLEQQPRKKRNPKMAHSEKIAHQICALKVFGNGLPQGNCR